MKAIICDLDGTLCDVSHRRHFVSNGNKNYDAFNSACVDDPCVEPIRQLLFIVDCLNYHASLEKIAIILCSGRGNEWRQETVEWLQYFNVPFTELYMRAEKDYRSDVIVKREMLNEIRNEGYEVLFTIDDRASVVQMWRDEGLTCLQAAPGDFDVKKPAYKGGVLHLLIGPSGAGKSMYFNRGIGLNSFNYKHVPEFEESWYVGSDQIRSEICEDWRDQSKNVQVFSALHAIVKARLDNGLYCVVDATNIRDRDRKAICSLASSDAKIIYHVIDRPLADKKRDGGWRNEVMIGELTLVEKHHNIFMSNMKNIMNGDGDSRVTVKDCRT